MTAPREDRTEEPEWERIDKDDDVYTLDSFAECVRTGGFIDYDGFGEYATATKKDASRWIYPSQFNADEAKAAGYTHIVWYNR